MSNKLGKFKKGPVVKLPKKLGITKNGESEKNTEDEDASNKKKEIKDRGELKVSGICIGTSKQINSNTEDSDDDFLVPSSKPKKPSKTVSSSPDIDLEIKVPSTKPKQRQRQPKTKVENPTQPKPSNSGGRRKNKKDLEYALLFTASEEDKAKNIELRLGKVLDSSFTQNVPEDTEFYVRDEIHLESTTGVNKRLQQFVSPERKLWNLSSAAETQSNEFETSVVTESRIRLEKEVATSRQNVEKVVKPKSSSSSTEFIKPHLLNFISPVRFKRRLSTEDVESGSKSFKSKANSQISVNKSNLSESQSSKGGVERLVIDMLHLLRSKRHSDLVIYGREEKGIKVHQLMFEARCPRLLKEIVYETSASNERAVVALTCFSTAALKAFVSWVYGGSVEESAMKKNLSELRELELKFQVDVGTKDFEVQSSNEDSVIILESPGLNNATLENCLLSPVVDKKEQHIEPNNQDKNEEIFTNPVGTLFPECSLLDISDTTILKESEPVEPDVIDRSNCKSPDLFTEDSDNLDETPQFNFSELDTPTPPQFSEENDIVARSVCKSPDLFAEEDPEDHNWTPQLNYSLRDTPNFQVNFNCERTDASEDLFPGGDSYIFANIPSIIIHEDENARQTTDLPVRGRTTQTQKKKTGRKSRKSLSQDTRIRTPVAPSEFPSLTPLNMSPAVNNNPRTVNNPCGTPMLNYSLLDTPILKKELKRFGLKPLPRSKAKKILRHIHLETHK